MTSKINQKTLELTLQKQKVLVDKILREECHKRYAAKRIYPTETTKIIQGVRGSGKTFTTLHTMHNNGEPCAYVDFSNKSLIPLNDTDYSALIEGLAMVYGKCRFVIVDEFASHANWKRCFDTMCAQGLIVVGITSVHLAPTDLPERADIVDFHPLSFSEYCLWHAIDTNFDTIENKVIVRKAFEDYMMRGGFPALQALSRPKTAASYLIANIFKDDIIGDFRKTAYQQIDALANYLLNHSAELLNYKRLAEILEIRSEVSVKKYIETIKDSNAFSGMQRFAMGDKSRNVYEKIYLADPAFLASNDRNKRLETIVYLQLRRFCERYHYFMHYYANRAAECDFALCIDRQMKTIIQVMADYDDSALIKEKVAGLINLSKVTGCNKLYILTDSSHDEISEKGLSIEVMPVYEFLLDKNHHIVS